MQHFPLFLDLHNQPVDVIGGGSVASRKVDLLLRSGARVRVIAPDLGAELRPLLEQDRIRWVPEAFSPALIESVPLIIAATNDRGVNAAVAVAAKERGILVNAVDQPDAGNVIVPAIISRGGLTVAISSGGQAPVLARRLRARIESVLPTGLGELLELLARYRAQIRQRYADVAQRRRWYDGMLDGEIPQLIESGQHDLAEQKLVDSLAAESIAAEGSVALVGAGPGDPGLLTIAALRELQSADVIVYDQLVSAEVLDLARRDAERICVGKQAGGHSVAQQEIEGLLLKLAGKGLQVVRLKGGDPLIFARGGEELSALHEHGVPFRIVPGISAVQACAAYSGIPLTDRRHAQALRLVTAHCKGSVDAVDWSALAGGGETLAFYMGVREAPRIQARLIAHGLAANTPVACIENGSRPNQRVLLTELGEMASALRAEKVRSPALLIVGEVTRYAKQHHWFGAVPVTLAKVAASEQEHRSAA